MQVFVACQFILLNKGRPRQQPCQFWSNDGAIMEGQKSCSWAEARMHPLTPIPWNKGDCMAECVLSRAPYLFHCSAGLAFRHVTFTKLDGTT